MSWTVAAPVVVPIDFSGMSVEAVRTAIEIAGTRGHVHVVHVVTNFDQVAPGIEELNQGSDEERSEAVRAHFSEFLSKHGFNDVREVVLEGKPEAEIAEYANRLHAGLVVIPSHGYDGIKRLLLGSVAESVIRHAECGVLVLRRPDAE